MKLFSVSTALFLVGFCANLQAQTAAKDTTVERLKIRTSFAKSYFGVDAFVLSGGSTQYLKQNELLTTNFGSGTSTRLVLGATHFWGHADLYVSIPVARFGSITPKELQTVGYGQGVETGFRVFPWAVETGKLRPFVGISLKGFGFAQVSNEPNKNYNRVPSLGKTIFPYQAGLVYAAKNFLFQAGVQYLPRTNYQYPISRTQYADVKLSPWSFNVGMSYWINTNGSLASKRGVNLLKNGVKKLATKRRLDCWYVGVGPSGTFEMTKSEYVKDKYKFLEQASPGTLIPDLTAGRYFHKLDLNVGLSHRKMSYGSSGYNVNLNYKRRSVMLETYKFLGDYHGFVPYVGPTLAYEDLTFTDTDNGNVQTFREKELAVGIIFGWDIRISRSEFWLLRTNLRYTPNLHLKANDKKVMFDQMEFNFIQFIWFAGRKNAMK